MVPLQAAKDADALIFVTDWPEFKELDFSRLKSLMKKPVVIDAQNMLDSEIFGPKRFCLSWDGQRSKLNCWRRMLKRELVL